VLVSASQLSANLFSILRLTRSFVMRQVFSELSVRIWHALAVWSEDPFHPRKHSLVHAHQERLVFGDALVHRFFKRGDHLRSVPFLVAERTICVTDCFVEEGNLEVPCQPDRRDAISKGSDARMKPVCDNAIA